MNEIDLYIEQILPLKSGVSLCNRSISSSILRRSNPMFCRSKHNTQRL